MEKILDVKGLTKSYGDFVLENVNLELDGGLIMGLVGPNGAGKTTFIKSLMDLVIPDRGDIKIFGQTMKEYPVEIKQRIGFVFEEPTHYQSFKIKTIRDMIAPFYDKWNDDRFYELLKLFELPENKTPKKLSRGMRTKFALTLALSHDADFLILDEPTSGLDPVTRREVLGLLREVVDSEKKAILFSTHITTDLEKIADVITYIRRGHVHFTKTWDEMRENFGIIKGDESLKKYAEKEWITGIEESKFNVTALTSDIEKAKAELNGNFVIERAPLEDIMYFIEKGK